MKKKQEKSRKTRKEFAGEYRRLVKAIGKLFVDEADKAVEVIWKNEGKEREAALAIGKALAQCHDALRGDAGRVKDGCDLFQGIAGHPRCRLAPSSLRNYARFYRLHAALSAGGKIPPETSMSTYVVVSSLGDMDLQRQYLETAARDNLSVPELIRLVRGEPPVKEWYFRDYLDLLINGAVSTASEAYDAMQQEEASLSAEDREAILNLIRLLNEILSDAEKGGGR